MAQGWTAFRFLRDPLNSYARPLLVYTLLSSLPFFVVAFPCFLVLRSGSKAGGRCKEPVRILLECSVIVTHYLLFFTHTRILAQSRVVVTDRTSELLPLPKTHPSLVFPNICFPTSSPSSTSCGTSTSATSFEIGIGLAPAWLSGCFAQIALLVSRSAVLSHRDNSPPRDASSDEDEETEDEETGEDPSSSSSLMSALLSFYCNWFGCVFGNFMIFYLLVTVAFCRVPWFGIDSFVYSTLYGTSSSSSSSFITAEQLESDKSRTGQILFFSFFLEGLFHRSVLKEAKDRVIHIGKVIHKTSQNQLRLMRRLAHFLQTALQGLTFASAELRTKLPPPSASTTDSSTLDAVDLLLHTAASSTALVRRIVDFYELKVDRVDLHPRDFSLKRLLQSVLELQKNRFQRKSQNLRFRVVADDDLIVFLDSQRFGQIMSNFVSNAIKYTPEGAVEIYVEFDPGQSEEEGEQEEEGEVVHRRRVQKKEPLQVEEEGEVMFSRAEEEEEEDEEEEEEGEKNEKEQNEDEEKREKDCVLTIIVHDTGMGMGLEELRSINDEKMDEKAQQQLIDAMVKKKKHVGRSLGIGVGLAKQLLTLMEGSVRFESEEGNGTTVTITIPCSGSRSMKKMTSLPDDEMDSTVLMNDALLLESYIPDLSHLTVILVEDNAICQKIYCHYLQRLGLESHMFCDGLEAVKYLETLISDGNVPEPFAIVTDISMPRMDGRTFCKWCRAHPSGLFRSTPIVALSATVFEIEVGRLCQIDGFDAFYRKPIGYGRFRSLLLDVCRLIDERRIRQESEDDDAVPVMPTASSTLPLLQPVDIGDARAVIAISVIFAGLMCLDWWWLGSTYHGTLFYFLTSASLLLGCIPMEYHFVAASWMDVWVLTCTSSWLSSWRLLQLSYGMVVHPMLSDSDLITTCVLFIDCVIFFGMEWFRFDIAHSEREINAIVTGSSVLFWILLFFKDASSRFLVTADQRREENCRYIEQLREEQVVQETIIRGVSHDLGNELSGVRRCLEELHDHEDLREHLRMADSSCRKLVNASVQLVERFRLERGTFSLVKEPVDLYFLVTKTVEDCLFLRNPEEACEVVLNINDNFDGIWGDVDDFRLTAMIENLVEGALNHTTSYDSITINCWMNFEENGSSGVFNFVVIDTGSGIPPERLKTLFTENLLTEETIENRSSIGRRLFIDRLIAKRMGGDLTVVSKGEGQGTRVHFMGTVHNLTKRDPLPLLDETLPVELSYPHRRVLLIDDTQVVCRVLRHMLEWVNCEAEIAMSIPEADKYLEEILDGKFDGVFIDCNLTVLHDGIEFGKRVLAQLENRGARDEVVVVMMTSDVQLRAELKKRDLGFEKILGKPIQRPCVFLSCFEYQMRSLTSPEEPTLAEAVCQKSENDEEIEETRLRSVQGSSIPIPLSPAQESIMLIAGVSMSRQHHEASPPQDGESE